MDLSSLVTTSGRKIPVLSREQALEENLIPRRSSDKNIKPKYGYALTTEIKIPTEMKNLLGVCDSLGDKEYLVVYAPSGRNGTLIDAQVYIPKPKSSRNYSSAPPTRSPGEKVRQSIKVDDKYWR